MAARDRTNALLWQPRPDMPEVAVHTVDSMANHTGSWRSLRPVYREATAPCTDGCPAGEDVPAYFQLARQGHLAEAWRLIRLVNPFPAVCGRVCYHPCEALCNRHQHDEPVNIHGCERYLGDWGLANMAGLEVVDRGAFAIPRRVAVVGAGPAGLTCAHYLSLLGHRVTMFEASPVLGGMLALGIPSYRLPRDVLAAEVALALGQRVEVHLNSRLGCDLHWDDLLGGAFEAVVLAIGAHLPVAAPIEGAEREGVFEAVQWLRDLNLGSTAAVGRSVVVIGGGNVAVDAARCALRLGAQAVQVIYRRSRAEMPAHDTEVDALAREGIQVRYLVSPLSVLGGRSVEGLECCRMRLSEADDSGRRVAVPIAGSEFVLPVDTVIRATGQRPDTAPIALAGLQTNVDGTIAVGPGTLATTRRGVFVCGDAATGPARVVDAIAAGRKAALSVIAFLSESGGLESTEQSRPIVFFDNLNMDYFARQKRCENAEVPVAEAVSGFHETVLPLAETEVQEEMARCFECGHCNGCDNCWLYCPDVAVGREGPRYAIDYEYCKGCAICVTECPRGAIELSEEPR